MSFRSGWVKSARVALSSAGGMAVVLAVFDLLQHRPTEGFGLLTAWGPWPFLGLVGLALIGSWMNKMSTAMTSAFSAVVTSVQQGADAHTKTADALTRLAEQGTHQAERVERLSSYAAAEFPNVYERMDRQDRMLEAIHSAVLRSGPNEERS